MGNVLYRIPYSLAKQVIEILRRNPRQKTNKERKNRRRREPLIKESEPEKADVKFDETLVQFFFKIVQLSNELSAATKDSSRETRFNTSYVTHLLVSTASRSAQTDCRKVRGDHFVGD